MSEFDFSNEIDEASWELLEQHHKREALFLLSQELDLATVAQHIAKDSVAFIKEILDNKSLRRPDEDEVGSWEKNPKENFANFIIVQPYVLIQLKPVKH
jgi:hypothetical protein